MEVMLKGLIDDYNGQQSDVTREAIVNAFDNNASEIAITIKDAKKILEVIIEDNGDGFTQENQKHFSIYKDKNFKKNNSKGSGRISFLKYFDEVNINSTYLENDIYKKIEFKFNENFIASDILDKGVVLNNTIQDNGGTLSNILTPEVIEQKTILTFIGHKTNKKIQRNTHFKLQSMYQYILEELAPLFLNIVIDDKKKFKITIMEKDEQRVISDENFQTFKKYCLDNIELSNKIQDSVSDIKLNIYYSIIDTSEISGIRDTSDIWYCACDRVVKNNGGNIDIGDDKSLKVYILSDFLDNKVIGEERTQFKKEVDSLIASDFNKPITTYIKNIIDQELPEVEEHNNQIENKILLYDKDSFNKYKEIKIGKLNLDDVKIHLAKEETKIKIEFESVYEQIFEKLYKKNFDNEFSDDETRKIFDENIHRITNASSDMSDRQLAEYIRYREKIIALLRLCLDKNLAEDYFHMLLSPVQQYKELSGFQNEYFENNLWLLDDRFMCFNYVSSNTPLHTILEISDINGTDNIVNINNKPDLVFSLTKSLISSEYCCIIELKKSSVKGRQANNIQQIDEYCMAIAKHIREKSPDTSEFTYLHAILITSVDKAFEANIIRSDGGVMIYKTHKTYYVTRKEFEDIPKMTIYILDYEDVYNDAKQRNDVFMKHLKEKDFSKMREFFAQIKSDELASKK